MALLTLLVALSAGGGLTPSALPGLPDAGAAARWGLPATTLLFHLAAVVAVGSLLVGVALTGAREGVLHGAGLRAVRGATPWAVGWALLAGLTALLTVSDITGLTVPDVLRGGAGTWNEAVALPGIRGLLLSAACAASVAAYATAVRTSTGGWLLLLGASLAITPVLFAGHSSSASGHALATTALVVHVLAATLWVGGLLGLVLHLRGDAAALATAVPAFSLLAAGCLAVVAATGVAGAWTRLGSSADAWASGYGAVVLAKVAALALLAVLGWQHRARTLPGVAAGAPGSFRRLAAVEVVVMAAATALGVALARTPTPPQPAAAQAPAHGLGHATLDETVPAFSWPELLSAWRPDAVALVLVALAAVLYLRGVRRVHRTGVAWPAARTAAFGAGLGLALLATCGGVALYAPALLSVHVSRFLALSLVVPLLLVLGRPLLLAEQVHPARSGSLRAVLRTGPVGRAVADPVVGALAYVALGGGLYLTGLLDVSLRSVQAHLVASGLEVVVGLLLVSALLPAAAAPRGRRTAALLAVGALLGGLALVLSRREGLVAEAWFGALGWSWADPFVDQRRAGAVLALALQVLGPLLLVAIWWGHEPRDRERGRAEGPPATSEVPGPSQASLPQPARGA